ncbi:MAG: hypothetical protein NTY90_00460, partial [Candidatus Micrarchaeota archaeon]|nr:hypothetical protein [Candidatus Micrarchaeota archaeon]
IERFGGPEKFNARRISEKHLVVRADAGVDFDKLVEMAGPKASYWKTNVWRGKPKWWRLP